VGKDDLEIDPTAANSIVRIVKTRTPAGEPGGLDAIEHRLANGVGYRVGRSFDDARSQLIHTTVVVVSFLTTLVVDVVVYLIHVARILRERRKRLVAPVTGL
jgi:hypothetical protein